MQYAVADQLRYGCPRLERRVQLDERVRPEIARLEVLLDEATRGPVPNTQEALNVLRVIANDRVPQLKTSTNPPASDAPLRRARG